MVMGVAQSVSFSEDMAVSVAGSRSKPYAEPKTTGIKVRGTGAATKGLMARGRWRELHCSVNCDSELHGKLRGFLRS